MTTTGSSSTPPVAPLLVWWVFWFSMTTGLIMQRVFLGSQTHAASAGIVYIALAPLAVSAAIRFWVLPRMKTRAKAFPVFVAGMATAEACGLIGVILGGEHRDTVAGIGLGMLLAYIPGWHLSR